MSYRHIKVHTIYDVPQKMASKNLNLANIPIHPIWRQEAFRNHEFFESANPHIYELAQFDMPTEIYQRMKPALRLATILLERSKEALIRLVFAPLVLPTESNGLRAQMVSPDWMPPRDVAARFNAFLEKVSRLLRIHRCDRRHKNSPTDTNITGIHDVEVYPGTSIPILIRCAVSDEFLKELDNPQWGLFTPKTRNSTLALLAVTLWHELIHVLWKFRHLNAMETELAQKGVITHAREPILSATDVWTELGTRFELAMFGGGPQCRPMPNAGRGWTLVNGAGGTNLQVYNARRWKLDTIYDIADETVSSWFDAQTWFNADGTHRDIDIYLLPSTLPAYGLPNGPGRRFNRH